MPVIGNASDDDRPGGEQHRPEVSTDEHTTLRVEQSIQAMCFKRRTVRCSSDTLRYRGRCPALQCIQIELTEKQGQCIE